MAIIQLPQVSLLVAGCQGAMEGGCLSKYPAVPVEVLLENQVLLVPYQLGHMEGLCVSTY